MRTVYKYPLDLSDRPQVVQTRDGARPVLVAMQNGRPCLWMETDTRAAGQDRRAFAVFGTGQTLPDGAVHVGSCMDTPYVWHVYETPLPRP